MQSDEKANKIMIATESSHEANHLAHTAASGEDKGHTLEQYSYDHFR